MLSKMNRILDQITALGNVWRGADEELTKEEWELVFKRLERALNELSTSTLDQNTKERLKRSYMRNKETKNLKEIV